MERMRGPPSSRHAKSSSAQVNNSERSNSKVPINGIPVATNSNAAAAAANAGDPAQLGPQQSVVREQDQYMPIANVIRIMRRILPPHAKISDDAKETIQECVSEYIAFITGEANERCQREQRKTVTAEDILWAMGKLGFDNYVEPLTLFLQKHRESENSDRSTMRAEFMKRDRAVDFGPAGPPIALMPPPPPYGGLAILLGPSMVLECSTHPCLGCLGMGHHLARAEDPQRLQGIRARIPWGGLIRLLSSSEHNLEQGLCLPENNE
ncbi:hypothetical protein Pyn_19367 [Prunus yedoensis var. nudiflora]|uniref:Transcription factor CBF/NF-Y/archaeal histone domain-containing protein n=1 Tax=Prunus yedoensis var. nudiflora TaxID=2094558 RepID=A0A314UUJ4_PRUYE|nr:hypothetical protein Pyn_19367 [Prunus yedoensis var. nudiflora]